MMMSPESEGTQRATAGCEPGPLPACPQDAGAALLPAARMHPLMTCNPSLSCTLHVQADDCSSLHIDCWNVMNRGELAIKRHQGKQSRISTGRQGF